eukprot:765321-Hanusia_phi.AAC.3
MTTEISDVTTAGPGVFLLRHFQLFLPSVLFPNHMSGTIITIGALTLTLKSPCHDFFSFSTFCCFLFYIIALISNSISNSNHRPRAAATG